VLLTATAGPSCSPSRRPTTGKSNCCREGRGSTSCSSSRATAGQHHWATVQQQHDSSCHYNSTAWPDLASLQHLLNMHANLMHEAGNKDRCHRVMVTVACAICCWPGLAAYAGPQGLSATYIHLDDYFYSHWVYQPCTGGIFQPLGASRARHHQSMAPRSNM
jgi:hypothetical protein